MRSKMQVIVDYDGKNKLSGCAYFQGSYSSIRFLDYNCEDTAGFGCTHYRPFEWHNVGHWFELNEDESIRCSSFEAAKWLLEKAEID